MSLRAARGFTIVELLIVIVVIAVLAAVTAVAYTNMQGRARDSQRLTDMKTIMKALEVYKTHNGSYPDEVGTVNASGWEITSDGAAATNFLSALVSANGISKVPLDPRNAASNTGAGSLNPSRSAGNFVYYYHRYPAGANGCDVNRGDFYVLGITRMDTVASGGNHAQNPGFVCSGFNWATSGAWQTGAYTNG